MDRSGPAVRTELLELYFGRTFRHTDVSTVIPAAALSAFQPYIFTFTFLLGHIFNLVAGRAFNLPYCLTDLIDAHPVTGKLSAKS